MLKCDGENCEQYASDLEILSQFPFTVGLDYKQQGPDKSTAILDSNGTSVVMIQLRQPGSTVPESVFCLKNLQSLDIMNMIFMNGIVPDTLSNLQQLFSLSITNTPIIKMTDSVATLKQLQSLTLNNCSLAYMPNLSGMTKLLTVSLPNNRLSKLEGLVGVRSLSLYKNLFTEIPTLTEPEGLSRLDMNYNPVQDMDMITAFVNLTDARLSFTKISVIPTEINELEKLYSLDLAHTQITQIPKTILTMARLKYLIIQGNSFADEEINSMKNEFGTQRPDLTLLI
jgi:leucine-rich repeat protein SHOC2